MRTNIPKDPLPIVDAKCPFCGQNHQVRLNWLGNCKPRLYCEECKKIVANRSGLRNTAINVFSSHTFRSAE